MLFAATYKMGQAHSLHRVPSHKDWLNTNAIIDDITETKYLKENALTPWFDRVCLAGRNRESPSFCTKII